MNVKLFDTKPTIREVFYQRALQYIVHMTDADDTANIIASEALYAAGASVVAPEEAEAQFRKAVETVTPV